MNGNLHLIIYIKIYHSIKPIQLDIGYIYFLIKFYIHIYIYKYLKKQPVKAGLYSGRAWFVFPEYSRWVHLGTNTLPMMKICPRVKGFGHDIHSIPGDENT